MTLFIEYIDMIPLFQGLPRVQQERLASIVTERHFSKGDPIFFEGETAAGFYVVISGRVKVFKLSSEGKEQILHLFAAGEPFGEVPVFTGREFPAHAEAMEESRVLFFPRKAFISLIREDPTLALNMLAVLSRRLHQFTSLVEDLSLKEVPGRLAAYLLYLSANQGGGDRVTLDMSKAQLSSLLGTIPETLSRVLGRLHQAGMISSEGTRDIALVDRRGLEELASGERRLASDQKIE